MKGNLTIRGLLSLLCAASLLFAQDQSATVERPGGAIFIRPYKGATVTPTRPGNSSRLHSLIRGGKLYLTVQDAIALVIENNLNLEIDRFGLPSAEWAIERQQGGGALRGVSSASSQIGSVASGQGVQGSINSAGLGGSIGGGGGGGGNTIIQQVGPVAPNFDPVFQNSTSFSHLTYPQSNPVVSQIESLIENTRVFNTRLQQGVVTGGSYYLQLTENYLNENAPGDVVNPSVAPKLQFYFQQNIFQGRGIELNTRFIRVAKKNMAAAEETYRSQLLDTVANVVNLYWDLVTADETLRARQNALNIAQKFYDDTNKQIELGTLAPIERPRARAELDARKQDLTLAIGDVQQQEIHLKDMLSRAEDPLLEAAEIIPLDRIEVPEQDTLPPLRDLVKRALEKRPDVAVQRIRDETALISAKGTENGLQPRVQAYGSLYNVGAAGTQQTPDANPYFVGGFGTALGQVFRRNFPNEYVGVQGTMVVNNRVAQADYGIEQLQLQQSQLSGQKSLNQVIVDISNQMIALQQARSRYSNAVATRVLQGKLLTAEQQKFSLGSSTISALIIVARALVAAQTTEITAQSQYQHARISLDQVLGETLEVNHVSFDEGVHGHVERESRITEPAPASKKPAAK